MLIQLVPQLAELLHHHCRDFALKQMVRRHQNPITVKDKNAVVGGKFFPGACATSSENKSATRTVKCNFTNKTPTELFPTRNDLITVRTLRIRREIHGSVSYGGGATGRSGGFHSEIPPPPPRPEFDSSREKLQKLGEGEGSMTAKEFNKMKLKLEAKALAT
ncbi:hypothetical protein OUZ56_032891 [Daphnia magna]|uniref:Uncharacterized protein n=1 Tax=Daphnia magna TaxID=35525 RepID=A0ABR0B9T4_9CRUS|nr:hypothetical protein OUZ56_032891 [Daphnia magna]